MRTETCVSSHCREIQHVNMNMCVAKEKRRKRRTYAENSLPGLENMGYDY